MTDAKYLASLTQFLPLYGAKMSLLLDYFGSAEKIWQADSQTLSKIGLPDKVITQFELYKKTIDPEKFLQKLKTSGIDWVTIQDKNYPANLKGLKDCPLVLFYRGNLKAGDKESVSIVGARKSTAYGREVAYQFAGDLAAGGVTVISGLARGIDTQAHLGALAGGGRTIAVLTDLVDIYPPENIQLASKIIKNGCLISEFPPGVVVSKASFVWRNRIVSGLAKAVVVVEGEKKSGTLITASFAADQGKPVFAIPGPISSPNSYAPNYLIRTGAILTMDINDILDEVNLKGSKVETDRSESNDLALDELEIVKFISKEYVHIDELARISGVTTAELSAKLTIMETKGVVKNLGNGMYKKK